MLEKTSKMLALRIENIIGVRMAGLCKSGKWLKQILGPLDGNNWVLFYDWSQNRKSRLEPGGPRAHKPRVPGAGHIVRAS